jgi:hypothetical protein
VGICIAQSVFFRLKDEGERSRHIPDDSPPPPPPGEKPGSNSTGGWAGPRAWNVWRKHKSPTGIRSMAQTGVVFQKMDSYQPVRLYDTPMKMEAGSPSETPHAN